MSADRELDAAGVHDPALRASYRLCRRINAQHGRTFYLATLLLPPAKRPYVHALYGFARHVDDIVDEFDDTDTDTGSGTGPVVPNRSDRFAAWSQDFLADLDWGATSDPVSRAVLDTIDRWQIPHGYFADFLDAMRLDLTVTGYPCFDDLAGYMWGSSAVIGLQMLPILGRADGVPAEELEPRAVEAGMAFQLTNFVRDVAEDLRRGRVYLPQDSLDMFGVDRERLARGRVDEPIRNLLAFQIERARSLYRSAEAGVALVQPSSQDCLRTALILYERILDEIERADYDVFSRRISVSLPRRALVGISGLRRAWHARRDGRAVPTSTASPAPWRNRTADPRPGRRRSADR